MVENKVFLGGLSQQTSKLNEHILSMIGSCVWICQWTGLSEKNRGFGFVTFEINEGARQCLLQKFLKLKQTPLADGLVVTDFETETSSTSGVESKIGEENSSDDEVLASNSEASAMTQLLVSESSTANTAILKVILME